jgi:acetyl-CoA carboxylase alpha subunit
MSPDRVSEDRASARTALTWVTDGFTELPSPSRESGPSRPGGPIGWPGYDDALSRARERTGERESVVCGTGTVGGRESVLVSFEFGFLGGSLGESAGDLIEAAFTHARERRLPVVSLVATGGSRMQEGMAALAQLQRVARQSALTRQAGLPQLAVVRDPSAGGGWATMCAGADVTLALPGAQAGFAGSRVRPAWAEPHAYTAEGQLEAGQLDAIVPSASLGTTLGRWLSLLTSPRTDPAPPPHALGNRLVPETGWEAVRRARAAERPRAERYLEAYFDWYEEIRGDRCGGTDPGVRCGFGQLSGSGTDSGSGEGAAGGSTVAFAAQCGTQSEPAGFRTAARLIRLADRLGIPVLTLIDTPGAANGPCAESAGAGAAIADCFSAIATARVPVTTLVIGEGGSGGALALAAPDATWATPDSYFSVIAPELAAAILKRDAGEVRTTAEQLRLRPQDLVELGLARGVVGTAE